MSTFYGLFAIDPHYRSSQCGLNAHYPDYAACGYPGRAIKKSRSDAVKSRSGGDIPCIPSDISSVQKWLMGRD